MKCSVCGKEKTEYLCLHCGFDESCNYDYLKTFAPVPDGTKSLPGRFRDIISSLETSAKKVKKPEQKKPSSDEINMPKRIPEKADKDLKKPRRTKKIIIPIAAILVVIAIIIGISVLPSDKSTTATTAKQESTEKVVSAEVISNAVYRTELGNIYKFGSYEQDNDTSNGKEEIEWIVLAKEDNKVLLLSRYALDCQPYNEEYTDVTWETCTLRKWLNEDFYNTAFSSDEQSKIQTTTVTADKNQYYYDTNPGSDTQDKVFLLSYTEAEKHFSSAEARRCVPTDYAKAQGVYASKTDKTADGKAVCWWWLRTPGSHSDDASYIKYSGNVSSNGGNVSDGDLGLRPALWINLES